MRYSSEHKAATRQHLLETAGALAKEKGFGTTGVDALMAAAGLTAGAFYAHFGSKAEMLQALVRHEMERSLAVFGGQAEQSMAAAVASYLSLSHVEHPERGCVLPALAAEVARADTAVQETFEQQLLAMKDRFSAQLGDEQQAWSALAQMVGAVLLARAMHSRSSRKAVLDGARESILGRTTAAKKPARRKTAARKS